MASAPHKILEHGDIQPLAPGLWFVRGSLPFPLMRNTPWASAFIRWQASSTASSVMTSTCRAAGL